MIFSLRACPESLPAGLSSVAEIAGRWSAFCLSGGHERLAAFCFHADSLPYYFPQRRCEQGWRHRPTLKSLYKGWIFIAGDPIVAAESIHRRKGECSIERVAIADQTGFRAKLIDVEAKLKINPTVGGEWNPQIGDLLEVVAVESPWRGQRGKLLARRGEFVDVGLDVLGDTRPVEIALWQAEPVS
jgi:hypothetical protein